MTNSLLASWPERPTQSRHRGIPCAESPTMRGLGPHGWSAASLALIALFLALGLHSEYWLGVLTRHSMAADFRIYWDAYWDASAGGNPYLPYEIGLSFVYHPSALTLVSAFSWHGIPWLASVTWMVASAAAWAVSVLVSLRLLGSSFCGCREPRRNRWTKALVVALLVGFAPLWETLHLGQINAFVVLSLVLCFYFFDRDSPILSGILLGFAIVLKTSPVILVPFFLAVRRYRTVAGALTTVLLLSLIAALQFSPRVLSDFLAISPLLASKIHPGAANESMLALLWRLLSLIGLSDLDQGLLFAHAVLFAGTVCLLMVIALRIPREAKALQGWLFVSLIALMTIFSPLVWYHHNTFLLLPLVWLMATGRRSHLGIAIGAATCIQAERLFEQVVGRVSIPVLLGQLAITGAVAAIYLRGWWDLWSRRPRET